MTQKILLETRHLCKNFRTGGKTEVRALEDLSLTIEEGTLTVLTGPSGCGKTTLLSLLGAMDRPSSGQIFFRGTDLSRFSDVELARWRRKIGFVFQNFSLIAGLPIWENITYPLIPCGVRGRERWAIAQQLLLPMGMADKLLRRPQELSGGEQQRVAIARALAGQPEIVLADEPISNLDQANSQAVMSLFQAIQGSGKTVILAVHDPSAVTLPARIYRLESGKLKEER